MSVDLTVILSSFLIFLFPPILATLWEKNKDNTLDRLPYLLRAIAIFVVCFIVGFTVGFALPGSNDSLVSILITVPIATVGYIWAIQRLRSIGWSIHLIWIHLLPVINLIFALILLIKPARTEEDGIIETTDTP